MTLSSHKCTGKIAAEDELSHIPRCSKTSKEKILVRGEPRFTATQRETVAREHTAEHPVSTVTYHFSLYVDLNIARFATMANSDVIIFYDIPDAKGAPWSPNTWKTR